MAATPISPLPPPPICQIPQGLLGLLQLKETGKTPSILSNVVQGQIDLTQLYLQRGMQPAAGLFGGQPNTASIPTGGHGVNAFLVGGVGVAVPENEMWYCDQISAANNTIPAADSVTAAVLITGNIGGVTIVTPPYADVISARTRSWITQPLARPIWLWPGTSFALLVYDIVTAGGLGFTLDMRATRIPI